jgi:hypothetical protein
MGLSLPLHVLTVVCRSSRWSQRDNLYSKKKKFIYDLRPSAAIGA